jgi:ATP-dependent exoDNAse (exonuclease V) beta subunit
MSSLRPEPPDQPQRERALDPGRSILVQAPAGSGKTDLLTRRFLRLLGEVDEPGQVVAITFTNAAAAEMRHRILAELEKTAVGDALPAAADEFGMDALARRALTRSQALGWKLLDLPAQLRICTIDSFCRDLALQQPLLSGLGGGLDIAEQPEELYRRAARQTLERIGQDDAVLSQAIEALLVWRDNNWQEMEDLLVQMLGQRDRWMHEFVLGREQDWEALRERLERPFINAVREVLTHVDRLFGQVPGAREEALGLARFAFTQTGSELLRNLAELAEFPPGPFSSSDALEEACDAYLSLDNLLLTGGGAFRKAVDKRLGFPADRKGEKKRILDLIAALGAVPGLEEALAAVRGLPQVRYSDEEWQIVRACFTLLRHAAGELKVVFAEAGRVDFIEVAQIAQNVLAGADGLPTDAALAVADGIRHLLVDESQDTSRRQHQLLARLIAAWEDRNGRTAFVVGDPMQSIYGFREADAELFGRLRDVGLEIPQGEPVAFDFVSLQANFRTAPPLVERLNEVFAAVFAADDGRGVTFSSAEPAREAPLGVADPRFNLHLNFVPKASLVKTADLWPNASSFPLHRNPYGVVIPPWVAFERKARDNGTQPSFANSDAATEKEDARAAQTEEIVALIQSQMERMEAARARGEKYRIAVLGRTRNALAPVAEALREAAIPFRAVDLEKLKERPEVLDALALARALFNPHDRVAWLGVLRAPWCGLALDDLHRLASADDEALLARPVPELLAERLPLLSEEGRRRAGRVLDALAGAAALRSEAPAASPGTWLEGVWLRLGGADCVDATARANLDLLWNCLDRLPAGAQDLLGPALDAALDKLTALPDPEADGDCGVQLMTIHKSKGLEFEVVIVPDLQAGSGKGEHRMLSWLERGLPPEAIPNQTDSAGEITEFLVAPLQPKGADRGKAKEWVDRVYARRESQEDRRILYVAATRAREELHLFARPAYKVESNGELSLPEPKSCLLATAWPALEDEVRARFEEWKKSAGKTEAEIESIAASGDGNLLVMPTPAKPAFLRRLPPDYEPLHGEEFAQGAAELAVAGMSAARLYDRHEGGVISRALGAAVHALLEELARFRAAADWDAARAEFGKLEPRIAAQIRAAGIETSKAGELAAQALGLALSASSDPLGQWILSPHAGAGSEVSWAGVVAGGLRTVRVDRVFQAGPTPGSEGEECWWIIDYKTAHADNPDPAVELAKLRPLFAPQIEAYAQVLRNLRGQETPVRGGLYYPRMALLDWWEL